jgi:hypothetical protein
VESLMKCSRSGTDVLRCRSQQHRHQASTIRAAPTPGAWVVTTHGKHDQVDHMGPMGSKFRCPTEIPDASVVRHDVADARGMGCV